MLHPDETGDFERTSKKMVGGVTSFDPRKKLLTIFSKSRGPGDCGSLAEYRLTDRELELETFRYRDCGDSDS